MTGVSTMLAALQAAGKNVGTKAKSTGGASHHNKPAQVGPCCECGAMGHVASNCPRKKGKGITAACCTLPCGMCVCASGKGGGKRKFGGRFMATNKRNKGDGKGHGGQNGAAAAPQAECCCHSIA